MNTYIFCMHFITIIFIHIIYYYFNYTFLLTGIELICTFFNWGGIGIEKGPKDYTALFHGCIRKLHAKKKKSPNCMRFVKWICPNFMAFHRGVCPNCMPCIDNSLFIIR